MILLVLFLIILFLVVAGLGISALRNRVVFKMGVRNIGRRKGNTLIMIMGLMIGTAIIAASFTIGDTMTYMVDSVVVDALGEVDLMIMDVTGEQEKTYLPYQDYEKLKANITAISHVEGVSGEFSDVLPVICFQSRQSEPGMQIMGVNAPELDAFGGLKVNGQKIEFDLADNEVYLNEKAATNLDAKVGYYIQIINASSIETGLPQMFRVKDIVDSEGYANWLFENNIIVDIETAWTLFEVNDVINIIKITNEGDEITGAEYSNQVEEDLKPILEDYPNLEIVGNKHEEIENNREDVSQLTDLFLVFGTFTIIAGVILIINIFVMLAEERKTEMGISRAIGMKRKHLKRAFLYEGSVYAVIAGIVGILFGLCIAYLAMWAIRDMFSAGEQEFDVLQYYTFTIPTLVISFTIGFLITLATILFVTGRISKLNIVRAIRKIPEPLIPRKDTRILMLGVAMLILSIFILIIGILIEQQGPAMTGLSIIV